MDSIRASAARPAWPSTRGGTIFAAGGIEAVWGDDANLATAGGLGGEDAVTGGGGDVHGFFNPDVLAGVEDLDSGLGV